MSGKLQHLKGKPETGLNATVMEIKMGSALTHTQPESKTAENKRILVQSEKGKACPRARPNPEFGTNITLAFCRGTQTLAQGHN